MTFEEIGNMTFDQFAGDPVAATQAADAATLTAATLNTDGTDTPVPFGSSEGTAHTADVYGAGSSDGARTQLASDQYDVLQSAEHILFGHSILSQAGGFDLDAYEQGRNNAGDTTAEDIADGKSVTIRNVTISGTAPDLSSVLDAIAEIPTNPLTTLGETAPAGWIDADAIAADALAADGVSMQRLFRSLLAFAGGKMSVADGENGLAVATFYAQDGVTVAHTITFDKATGARTAATIGS